MKKIFLLFITSAFLISCSGNLLSSFGDATTDEALIFAAKQSLDKSDFSGAITSIAAMSTAGQAGAEALELKASAFAGRCGFQFLTFVQSLSGSGTFFNIFMNAMTAGTDAKRDDCVASVNAIKEISTDASLRTADQNILMAFVSLALLGTILNKDADTDDDGTVDAGFDHCATMADSDINLIVSSMANASLSLTAIGSSTISGVDLDGLTSSCSFAGPPAFDFCSRTDPDTVTALERQAMKGVIGFTGSDAIGVGTNNTPGDCTDPNNIGTCALVCP